MRHLWRVMEMMENKVGTWRGQEQQKKKKTQASGLTAHTSSSANVSPSSLSFLTFKVDIIITPASQNYYEDWMMLSILKFSITLHIQLVLNNCLELFFLTDC